jgi:protease IV
MTEDNQAESRSGSQAGSRASRKGFWIAIVLLVFLLLLSLAANFGLFVGISMMGARNAPKVHAMDQFPQLGEHWSYGSGEIKAARIPISGIITRQDSQGFFEENSYDPVETVLRQIRAASNDENIKALILEIDSPGGDITSTDEIYEELLDFKRGGNDRVILAFVRGLAASGGYYVAMAADWIIAEPTAIVGSISVIMQTLNWKELSDKIGVRDVTIKTGGNKDLLNPFRDVEPAQLAILQEIADAMHAHFLNVVTSGRGFDPADLESLADGRIFTVKQALENDMIDQSGYWPDVMDRISEMLGEEKIMIVRFEEKTSFFERFAGIRSPFDPGAWLNLRCPRLMYLWNP